MTPGSRDATHHEAIERYVANHPHAGVMDVLGALRLSPDARPIVESIVKDDNPTPESAGAETNVAPEPATESEQGEPGELTDEAIRAHYRRIKPVMRALGSADGVEALGVHDHFGWYLKRPATDVDAIANGWTERARGYSLAGDVDELAESIDRTYYATLNYQDHARIYRPRLSKTKRDDNGDSERIFAGDGNPLPDPGDVATFALFADIDLRDEHKERPLPPAKREQFERVIAAHRDAFADLVDTCDAVTLLDSVGGAYAHIRPGVTAPIFKAFDRSDRRIIFDVLKSRAKDWLADRTAAIYDETGTDDLAKTDLVINVNRQYKAPLSLHSSIDGVVHPLDVDEPRYEYVPFDAVDDDLIAETREWAERFTAPIDAHGADSPLETLVATLFAEYYDRDDYDVTGWRDALAAHVDETHREARARLHNRAKTDARRRKRYRERKRELAARADQGDRDVTDRDVRDSLRGSPVTPVLDDVFETVDTIDVRDVIRSHAADAWDTDSRSGQTSFDPSWRTSESGSSCYVKDGDTTLFGDNACNGGGGPVKAYALGTEIIPGDEHAAAMSLRGEQWWDVVDGLRSEGYDIPVYVPEAGATNSAGETYDQTPLWALREAAVALGVVDADAFIERETDADETYDGFPDAEAYNETVRRLEDEHGIDTGREPVDVWGDLDPVGPLAIRRLAVLNEGQRRRYRNALPEEVRIPSDGEVADRIRAEMMDVLAAGDDDEGYAMIQAPTGSNKTGVAAETVWRAVDEDVTGGRPVVVFAETRDARDEVADRARDADLNVLRLLGHKELCPTAAGEYDPVNIDDDDPDAPDPFFLDAEPAGQWFDARTMGRSIPISSAHAEAERVARGEGKTLPCEEGEHQCAVKTQWPDDGLVDDDGPRYDIVVATDPFAFVPSLRTETNVIHDEQPDYIDDLGLDAENYPDYDTFRDAFNTRLRNAVTAYLGLTDEGPDTFEELVSLARECARCDAPYWNEQASPDERPDDDLTERWKGVLTATTHEPDERWYFTDRRAHTLAPAITKAIWKAFTGEIRPVRDPDVCGPGGVFDANGRVSATVGYNPPRLDADARDNPGWNRAHVTVTIDNENTVRTVRNVPDFRVARAVVGLDARPTSWLWQRNAVPDMDVRRVLDRDETRLWRRYKRGQTVVQIGTTTRPAGKDGRYFNERHAREVIEALREYFGDEFRSVGCPSTFEGDIADLMRAVGIDEPATLHHGEERSRNVEGFAGALAGLVYGCIDPGDDYVLDLLAECGLDARPARSETPCHHCATCEACEPGEKCTSCDEPGDGCVKCDGTGHKRAHGREFVGPDAEHAAAILESVRATHVAQMIGRFGRDLDVANGETNITFVATNAVPDDLVDYRIPDVQWTRSDTQRAILEHLDAHGRTTTRALADDAGCTKEHVRQTLARYEEAGVVCRQRGAARFGADEWFGDATGDSLSGYQLRLDDIAKITNSSVQRTNTWQLAIVDPHASDGNPSATIVRSTASSAATSAVDPPPIKLDD